MCIEQDGLSTLRQYLQVAIEELQQQVFDSKQSEEKLRGEASKVSSSPQVPKLCPRPSHQRSLKLTDLRSHTLSFHRLQSRVLLRRNAFNNSYATGKVQLRVKLSSYLTMSLNPAPNRLIPAREPTPRFLFKTQENLQ